MARWIDLRKEIDILFNGNHRSIGQAYWVVLRIMRLGQYSEYWDIEHQEAIGGAKWNYDDKLVRAISIPARQLAGMPRLTEHETNIIHSGMDDINTSVFAIQYDSTFRIPTTSDILFTIDKFNSKNIPSAPLQVDDRYNITGVIPNYGDIGRIEVVFIVAVRIHGES